MKQQSEEALRILQEECAEVIQAISKIFRFGKKHRYPGPASPTNLDKLQDEIGDVLAMVDILVESGVFNRDILLEASERKKIKLKTWSTVYEK